MENVPVIRIAARKVQPEYLERYERWMREAYFPMLIRAEGAKEIVRYEAVKESPEYPKRISIRYHESLSDWTKFENSPEVRAYIKDHDITWASRSEYLWTGMYQLIRSFRSGLLSGNEKEELRVEDAPIVHLEGYKLSPEEEGKYSVWLTKWGNEVYIPMLMRLPGLKEYARYRFMYIDPRPYTVLRTLPVEYPPYISILRFESLKTYENYEKSTELAAFREAMKVPFPKSLEFQWYVQYQLRKSWRK